MLDKWKNRMSKEEEASISKAIENQKKRTFREVPPGKYTVKVPLMEVGETSWGDKQINIRFQIQEGPYTNSIVFYNGALDSNKPNGTLDTTDIIFSLLDGDLSMEDIAFILQSAEPSEERSKRDIKKGLEDLEDFLEDVMKNVDGYEYELDYQVTYSKKTNPRTGQPYENKSYIVTPLYE